MDSIFTITMTKRNGKGAIVKEQTIAEGNEQQMDAHLASIKRDIETLNRRLYQPGKDEEIDSHHRIEVFDKDGGSTIYEIESKYM